MKDHAEVVFAHVVRDLLLEEGADGEVGLDKVHRLLDLLRGDGQPEVYIMSPGDKIKCI